MARVWWDVGDYGRRPVMRVYGIALLGIVVAAVLLGCITRRVKYQPDTSLDAERAKAIIQRVIEEQPATVDK